MDDLFKRPLTYVLADDGETPIPVDPLTWARWFHFPNNRIVAQTEIPNPKHPNQRMLISTVFIGQDMNWTLRGDPILWETMILHASGWDFDEYQERYASAAEARAGHQEALRLVEAKTGVVLRFGTNGDMDSDMEKSKG